MKRFKTKSLLAIAFILALSFASSAPAKEISKFDNSGKPIEFGTIREYTLDSTLPLKDSLLIENKSNISYYYELNVEEGISVTNGTLTAAYNTSATKEGLFPKFIDFSENNFVLRPNEQKNIIISISKPEIDYLNPGDYVGAYSITYSPLSPQSNGGGSLSFRTRNIINFVINVPGHKINNYEKSDFNATITKSNFQSKQALKNTGNTLLRITSKNTLLSGLTSKTTLTSNEISALIPPGNNFNNIFNSKLSPIFFEYYHFSQIISVFGYDSSIGVFTKINEFENNFEVFLPNYLHIFSFLSIIVIILITIIILKRRRSLQLKHSKAYLVKKSDTLTSVAEKNKLDWKTIVKLNKLKAPYILKEGNKIRLPMNEESCKKHRNKLK